jgi:hypothetical protein
VAIVPGSWSNTDPASQLGRGSPSADVPRWCPTSQLALPHSSPTLTARPSSLYVTACPSQLARHSSRSQLAPLSPSHHSTPLVYQRGQRLPRDSRRHATEGGVGPTQLGTALVRAAREGMGRPSCGPPSCGSHPAAHVLRTQSAVPAHTGRGVEAGRFPLHSHVLAGKRLLSRTSALTTRRAPVGPPPPELLWEASDRAHTSPSRAVPSSWRRESEASVCGPTTGLTSCSLCHPSCGPPNVPSHRRSIPEGYIVQTPARLLLTNQPSLHLTL